ncbi:MAG: AraC family transcriptional regulator [Lachnospiraceae bacterium]|nr:AraC family transcriptional regulator [Lachnospiraceae bacterium]
MELIDYAQYQETRLHEQPGFAYNTYLCTIPLDFPRVALHWHEQMEVIYVKKGRGTVLVDLQTYPVSAGCIIPILPGELHAIEGTPGEAMEYENIIYSLSILESEDEQDWCREHVTDALRRGRLRVERPLIPGTKIHTAAAAALDAADDACRERDEGYSLLVKSSLFLFLHALYANRNRGTDVSEQKEAVRLKTLLTYVKEHYGERLTVADAAELVGYSEAHFMRLFHKETGQTFISFLNDYRLTAAAYFLRETKQPIGEIASHCGFDNFSYFIRLFKKRFGVSPRVYRG